MKLPFEKCAIEVSNRPRGGVAVLGTLLGTTKEAAEMF